MKALEIGLDATGSLDFVDIGDDTKWAIPAILKAKKLGIIA